MRKRYATPHRSRVVKTRMTEEEYADFTGRLAAYEMSQAEFIRQAITRATVRPIITVSLVLFFSLALYLYSFEGYKSGIYLVISLISLFFRPISKLL